MFPANYRQVLTTPLFKMHECYQHRYTAAQFPNTHIPSNVMRQLFAKSRINTWQQTNPMAIAWPRTQIYLSFTNLLHFFSSHTLFPLISTSSSVPPPPLCLHPHIALWPIVEVLPYLHLLLHHLHHLHHLQPLLPAPPLCLLPHIVPACGSGRFPYLRPTTPI